MRPPLAFWLALAAAITCRLHAADGTWVQTAAGTYNWSTPANWNSNTIADGSGFTATFTSGTTGTQTVTLDSVRTIGNLTFGNHAWALSGSNTLTLAGSATPAIISSTQGTNISSVLDGTQGLNLTAGLLTLSGNNIYTGTTTVSTTNTVLTLAHNKALGSTTGETTVSSGAAMIINNGVTITGETLNLTGAGGTNSPGAVRAADSATAEWTGLVKLNGSVRVAAGSTSNTTAILKLAGVISNGGSTGNLLVTGGGTTVVSAANTYGGSTQIIRGTLKLDGGDNRLPAGTALDVWGAQASDNAKLDLNGFNQTVASLTRNTVVGTSTVTNSSGSASTFTVSGSSSTTYSGNITGNLSLVKAGSGTLTLTGANTFTGNTTVQGGGLSINSAFINDTSDVSISSGAVFNLNFSGPDTISGLYLAGIAQAIGTYGSVGGTATFQSAYFTGSGILNVTAAPVPEPSTFAALAGAAGLVVCLFRRRQTR